MATVEIVATGNELLSGDVLDSNTNWLCKQIAGLGGSVVRAVVIPDSLEAIETEVRAALARAPHLILTTGGLGPTADDMTLQAVARALGVELEEDPNALAVVRERYEEFARLGYVESGELTQSRAKMAHLPQGAQALFNPVGAAPAALVQRGTTTVVSLPGVPAELKGIFSTSLAPLLGRLFGAGGYSEAEIIVDTGDESLLAPLLATVTEKSPEVNVKSRPKRFGAGVRMRVIVSARGASVERAEMQVRSAIKHLREALREAGLEWQDPG